VPLEKGAGANHPDNGDAREDKAIGSRASSSLTKELTQAPAHRSAEWKPWANKICTAQVAPSDAAHAHVLHRDYETRSRVILKLVGAHRYAADPSTEVLCCAYAVDNDPVQLWRPSDPVPPEFLAASSPMWILSAHGDHFETAIEQHALAPRFGWPVIPIERHRCTMARVLAAGLPARLSTSADALELANRKDAAGERLMHQMSKPRRPRKHEDPAGIYWFDDADRLQRLYSYCKQDVEVERELFNRLPSLSSTEQSLWELSCRINERGFSVDRQFAEAARKIAQAAAPEIDKELAELTGGAVTSIAQVARLLAWLREQGCTLQKLNKRAIEQQLEREGQLTTVVQRVLELRLGGAQAAVKKIDALLARAGGDDRIRGAFRFHGAATGRWAGEGFQPQNLKRPIVDDLDTAITTIATGDYQHVRSSYPRPLAAVGDCSRAMICAAPGHLLIGADFSSIESRTLAWIAGEEWKLNAYRRFDATHDSRDEPYCETACRIFRVPSGSYTKDSSERSVGKTCDLAFGYQGGLNAWRKFEPDRFSDEEVQQFKKEWRAAHPKIRYFWHEIDRATLIAVRDRGRIIRCGPIALKSSGAFLRLRLPSGRKLSYPQPRVIGDEHEQFVVFADNAAGQFKDCRHGRGAYGGLWTENIVSGIARDLLAEAMLRVEAAGYPIVLHVHYELGCEVPTRFGSIDEFTHLMTLKPAWALDLPIAANAWSGPRFCK
jgi:DNA polymerase